MDSTKVDAELAEYESKLFGILARFTRDRDGVLIARADDPLFRQSVQELVDFFDDISGPSNSYSRRIGQEANEGVSNFLGSPSFKSVENILALVRAARTRFARGVATFSQNKSVPDACVRENIFIIHGRDEAKWRELKDIIGEFGLSPIVLGEEPDMGCPTVIEKFEHYARTCSYAIAVFTPDDEVSSNGDRYLQARPNVIYELGWFCAKLGRSRACFY